jgi:MFS family permease
MTSTTHTSTAHAQTAIAPSEPVVRRWQGLRQHLVVLLPVLLIALALRLALLLPGNGTGIISFHSDEAVIGLMARHILQGEFPVFFYGQAYMGSLDAFLVAGAFVLFGESVLALRFAQVALYLAIITAVYIAAFQITGRRNAAAGAALFLAIPNILLTVYTAATLGGYNETLLFGALLLVLGYPIIAAQPSGQQVSYGRWFALGLIAGLAWWSNGLIIAVAVPLGCVLLVSRLQRARLHAVLPDWNVRHVAAALLAFFIGSAPWWGYAITHDWSPILFYIHGADGPQTDPALASFTLVNRLLGFLLFGLTTLFGVRAHWSPDYLGGVVAIGVVCLYVVILINGLRRDRLMPYARLLLYGIFIWYTLVFFVSRSGIDPTGRYLLPLAIPLAILFGLFLVRDRIAFVLGSFLLAFNLWTVLQAASNPIGLTSHANLSVHITNAYDAELIEFLDEHDLRHGFTHYWIAFRIAFLSGEQMQYSTSLPNRTDLRFRTLDERYPPYREAALAAVEAGEPVAFITANFEELDALVIAELDAAGVRYRTEQIGPFAVYHDLEPAGHIPVPPFPITVPRDPASS